MRKRLNLYLLQHKEKPRIDLIKSIIVAAKNETQARLIHPCPTINTGMKFLKSSQNTNNVKWENTVDWEYDIIKNMWVISPDRITSVDHIGIATSNIQEEGVIHYGHEYTKRDVDLEMYWVNVGGNKPWWDE